MRAGSVFTNPVIGGGNTLIRTDIRSPDYVPGVSGWSIRKDGSAEFNDLDARGSIEAGNGTVRLNSGGVKVDGNTNQYDINFAAGFLARNVPDDGAYAQMTTIGGPFGGLIVLSSVDPSAGGNTSDPANVYAEMIVAGAGEQPALVFRSPNITGRNPSRMYLVGQSTNTADDDSYLDIGVNEIRFKGLKPGAGYVTGQVVTSILGGVGSGETQQFSTPTVTFKRARTYKIIASLGVAVSVANNTPLFRIRKNGVAGQQFDFFRIPCISTGTHSVSYTCYFEVGNVDVVGSIALTLTGGATWTAAVQGSATAPASITVYDDGATGRQPGIPVMV
jgi:hypothetical protein